MTQESKPNILQRINAVRAELDYVRKDQKKIDNMYTAVRYDDVVAATHALFVKHGIVAVTNTLPGWSVVDVPKFKEGKQTGFNTRLQGVFETTYYNVDDPKDFVVASAPGFGLDGGDKGAGKAHTYGAKSNHLKTFHLITGDMEEERFESMKPKQEEEQGMSQTRLQEALAEIEKQIDKKSLNVVYKALRKENGVAGNSADKALVEAASKRAGALKSVTADVPQ